MKNLLSLFKSLPTKTRQLFSAGILLALVVALPLFIWAVVTQRFELRKKALTSGSVLTIQPSNISVNPGDTFQVQIAVNTGDDTISAAELHLTYDSTNLDAQNITAGTYLPVILTQGQVGGGVASIILGSQPTGPQRGTGILATLSFKALSPSTTQLDFRSDTAVAAIGESGNRIASMTGGQVSVLGPTQSPSPSATPTASPTPSESPTGTPTESPTSTPTNSPNPSACSDGDKGNLNCDSFGLINTTDLSLLLASWCTADNCIQGFPGARSPDLNGDSKINTTDLSILLSNWKPI